MTADLIQTLIAQTMAEARRVIEQHGLTESAMHRIEAALRRLAQVPGLKDHASLRELP